jgi:two-component system sensor histidine kinase KdpD
VRSRFVRLLAIALLGVTAVTLALRLAGVGDATTIALGYLLITLFVASQGNLVVALVTSVAAALCFNYFFLPPVGTFSIADPHNWIALLAFLIVSVVASRLSASARSRAQEALDRRNELTRLFDLTRDILLTTERDGALEAIARHVARRFELDTAAICLPGAGGWQFHHGGVEAAPIRPDDLDRVLAANDRVVEFDARTRAYGGHRETRSDRGPVTLTPVRIGSRVAGVLATGGRALEPARATRLPASWRSRSNDRSFSRSGAAPSWRNSGRSSRRRCSPRSVTTCVRR